MAGFSDLLGAGQLGEKLADLAGRFVEGALKPMQIRRVAIAEAEAKITHAKADAQVRGINADTDHVIKEASIFREDDLRRTMKRLAAQEVTRQLNMENIVIEAAKNQIETVSSEPVADDWASAFFESCQDFSDTEMQVLWGRLLAGEVAKPGSISKPLLNAVRLMRSQDAQDFQKLCLEVFTLLPTARHHRDRRDGPLFFSLGSFNESAGGIAIERFELLQLIRGIYGVINTGLSSTRDAEYHGRRLTIIVPKEKEQRQGKHAVGRHFTQIGRELVSIVSPPPPQSIPSAVLDNFQSGNFSFIFHPESKE